MSEPEMKTISFAGENQSKTIGKLAGALAKAQMKMNGAIKGSNNPFFSSKYADLQACIEAAREPLGENELAVIQTTEPAEQSLDIITTLVHSSGEWIRGRIRMTPKKNDDQGRGSSITYGRRYAYCAIVGLAQKDDDGNGACVGEKSKYEDRKTVDRWLDWIDKFTSAGNLTQFEEAINTHYPNLRKSLSAEHLKEIDVATNEMKIYLTEKEGGEQ